MIGPTAERDPPNRESHHERPGTHRCPGSEQAKKPRGGSNR